MKVLNVHRRDIDCPIHELRSLLKTLSRPDDKVWPKAKWPAMRFKSGFTQGAHGGHGPIRYFIKQLQPDLIVFQFTSPNGFHGIHKFEMEALNKNQTRVRHIIDMHIKGLAIISWPILFRWLHDALIEDAFDNIQNHFSPNTAQTNWNFWVRFLRSLLK